MKMIPPLVVTDGNLASSNVPENDYPEYSPTTTYTTGSRVMQVATHSVYEAVQNTTGNDPSSDTTNTNWLRIGATNRWRAFDQRVGERTTNPESITYTFTAGKYITGLALFGMSASTLDVKVEDPTDGVVFDETYNLVNSADTPGWFTYFFGEIDTESEFLVLNMPPYIGATITVTLNSPNGTASLGQLVLGFVTDIGITTVGSYIGVEDYSRVETDQYGTKSVLKRGYSQTADYRVVIPQRQARRVQKIILEQRATPTVFFVDENLEGLGMLIYGIPKPITIHHDTAVLSEIKLEVEGLL